jgi:hypothetical protein
MQWRDVEEHLSGALGAAVQVRAVTRPAAEAELTPGERAQLPAGGRRHDWLLGRAALKLLLGGGDTSGIRFPDRCLSLSHAAGRGVAACCAGDQAGVGVDHEGWRRVDPRVTRFFLQDHERGTDDLLRLWTVKEALYKAAPDNARTTFLDYATADPGAMAGPAVDRSGRHFRYASIPVRSGWVTVAVCDGPV